MPLWILCGTVRWEKTLAVLATPTQPYSHRGMSRVLLSISCILILVPSPRPHVVNLCRNLESKLPGETAVWPVVKRLDLPGEVLSGGPMRSGQDRRSNDIDSQAIGSRRSEAFGCNPRLGPDHAFSSPHHVESRTVNRTLQNHGSIS